MRKQTAEYKDIKGLVTDVNINNNVGNPTFNNFSLTTIGKLTKRKGWENVLNYNEEGKDNTNLKIDFDRLSTGTGGYPLIGVFHIRRGAQVGYGPTIEYFDILHYKMVNNIGEIWRTRLNLNNYSVMLSKKISLDNQFLNVKFFRFIETPDQIYIISCGETGNTVYKYKFYEDTKTFDVDLIENISISSEIYVQAEVINGGSTKSEGGKYKYKVIPVYNTSSSGYINIMDKPEYYAEANIVSVVQSVKLKIYGSYDPHVIGYKIYRTKANIPAKPAKTPPPFAPWKKTTWEWLLYDSVGRPAVISNDYYFLGYYPKPNNSIEPLNMIDLVDPSKSVTISGTTHYLTETNITDSNIGDMYSGTLPVNYYRHNTSKPYPATKYVPTIAAPGIGMCATCGCYAQNRLFIAGHNKYPNLVFVSALDQTDNFQELIYSMDGANDKNSAASIECVGQTIYVWLRNNGLYALRPTASADVPYVIEIKANDTGCDGLNATCVMGDIAYYLWQNKLYALNEFGQYKEISAAINTLLAQKKEGTEAVIKANTTEKYVKIMFLNDDNEAVNIDYYPEKDMYRSYVGKKDIYEINGNTAELKAGAEHYQLVNFLHIPDVKQSWGVDADGNIVKEKDNYVDTSIGSDKVTWLNYTADNTNAVKNYPVEGILEKPFVFNSRVRFNSITLYGDGDIDIAYRVDTGEWTEYKTVTMTRAGVEVYYNGVGTIHSIRLRHTANSDIDFDYAKIKWTAQTNVDIANNTEAGGD